MTKSTVEIIHELFSDNKLDSFNLKISESKGTVFLEGNVDRWDQAVMAGHLAGSLRSVTAVVNDLMAADTVPELFIRTAGEDRLIGHADVVVIGAGVIGSAIARELSKFSLDIVLVEKESDVCCGASKANNGMVHSGIIQEPDTLRSKLNIRGNMLYENLCRELAVPFYRSSLITLIMKEEELFLLDLVKARGDALDIPIEILSREEALNLEPSLTPDLKGAFTAPSTAMTSPYKLTIAYAENAVENGVKLFLNTEVTGLKAERGKLTRVVTNRGSFTTRLCINAAGIYADKVAEMAGKREFTIHPRKGELILFDQVDFENHAKIPTGILAIGQDPYTKGGGSMVTTDGNPEWGPTAIETADREDTSVTLEGINRIIDKFNSVIPGFNPQKSIISFFAGVRAATYTEEFHIKPSASMKGLINVAGIQSPGLAAAPAIAEMVLELVAAEGFELIENKSFNPVRKGQLRFKSLPLRKKKELITRNPLYGQLVCRCEQVTEGEVLDSIHRPVPALTLDAIKRRTRIGMGRCQGGFCTPRLLLLLARELHLPLEDISKDGPGSELLLRPTKLKPD
ncbi:MAG: FAD-dependent oxidoreductase [Bacillota bacterium]|nr:FAD-dependent oxidoreductase [Bacillota bacterium]